MARPQAPAAGKPEQPRPSPALPPSRDTLRAFVVAFVGTLAVVVARFLFAPWLEGSTLLLAFVLPITLTAAYGGFVPGVSTTIACAGLGALFLLKPIGSLAIASMTDRFRFILFVTVGIAISTLNERAKRSRDAARVLAIEHRAARALADAGERLNLALQSAHAGWWEYDFRADRYTWSEETYDLHGIDPSLREPRLADWRSRIHPDDLAQIDAVNAKLFAERRSDFDSNFRVLHPERGERWLHSLGRMSYDDAGAPMRAIGIVRDITSEKHAEIERAFLLESERAARSEAERASRMKDEFLALLSHELRTPLTAMLGWAKLLRRPGVTPAQLDKGLAIIERNTVLQAELINDLLDVSRIAAGKFHVEMETIALGTVVEAAIDACRTAAEAKGVTLKGPNGGTNPSLRGDPSRLQQVVWNLVTNAIKFTPRGGQVEIAVADRDRRAVITVRDTGQGIAPDFLPLLFEQFRQADSSAARRQGGLGLGLSLVKRIVALHQGTVHAESEGPGKGSTFVVELPCEAGDERAAPPLAQSIAAGDPRRLKGARVLVVDDEADARELVRRVLEENEAKVWIASSASEALTLAASTELDLVVSDIGMPGMDGYTMLREMQAQRSAVNGKAPSAVAVTAFARPEDRERALAAGYRAHLSKPLDPSELVALLASLHLQAA